MKTKQLTKIMLLTLAIFFVGVSCVYALPENYEIVLGDVNIDSTESNLTFNVISDKAIINLDSFDIASTETVTFNGAASELLARVTGGNASYINGNLFSNLQMLSLVNTAGIHVGPSGNINASNLILSTRDITNSNFLDGDYLFERMSEETLDRLLLNEGTINITDGGYGVLIAGAIENKGIITAPLGKIHLACGDAVRLNMSGDGLISVAIEEKVARTILDYNGDPITDQIKSTGTISANGGLVVLNAESVTDIFRNAINLEGIVNATSIEEIAGEIRLVADNDIIVNTDEFSAARVEIITTGNIQIMSEIVSDEMTVLSGNIIQADTAIPLVTSYLDLTAREIYINSAADTTHFTNNAGDITIEDVVYISEDLVTIKGAGIGELTYMGKKNITLEVPFGDINTSAGVVIPGNQVKLSAKRIGSNDNPVGINADTTYINRIQGEIDITQMWGLGTTLCIRGPAPGSGDNWGAVNYNNTSHLILEAKKVTVSGTNPTYLHGDITFYNFECTVPDKEIYFEAEKTYTFKGSTYIEGIPGYDGLIKLLSSQEGTFWYSDFSQATGVDISYVAIRDAYNTGSPVKALPSTNWGNSYNWDTDPVWDGGGSDYNWSTALNWDTDTVPTEFDIVTFNATSTKDSTVDAGFGGTIVQLIIATGYTGTITLARSLTVNGDLTLTSGTLDLNGNNLTLTGTFSNNATLKLLGSETLTGFTNDTDSGTIEYTGGDSYTGLAAGNSYYHLTFSGSGTYTLTANLDINGNLTFTGSGTSSEYAYKREIIISNSGSSLTGYQVLITIDTASLISGGKMQADGADIRLKDSDDATELSYWLNADTINTSSTEIWVKVPSVPVGDKAIYLYYGKPSASAVSDGSATFEFFDDFDDGVYTDKWSVTGNYDVTTVENNGYIWFQTTASMGHAYLTTLNNISFENTRTTFKINRYNSSTKRLRSKFADKRHDFGYTNGYLKHFVDNSGYGSKYASSTIWYTVTTDITATQMQGTFNGETLTGTAGYSVLTGKLQLSSEDDRGGGMYVDDVRVRQYASSEPTPAVGVEQQNASSATLNAGVYDINIGGNLSNDGGTLNTSDTVTFDATSTGKTITSGGTSFNNLTFNGTGGEWTLQDALDVNGDLTITKGTLAAGAYAVNIAGSLTNSAVFTTSDTVTFDATSTGKTITSGGASFNNLTFDGSGGEWTLQDALDVNGSLSITNGTLAGGANSINIAGSLTNSATFTTSGTVTFDGIATGKTITSGGASFYDLTLNGAGGEWTLQDALDVDNNLTLTNGSLVAGAYAVNIGSDFSNSGTFTTSGTVTFDGTQAGKTITSGGASFNNLAFNGTGGGWTLQDALDVDNDLTITNGTLAAGSNSINIGGNFTNSAAFTTSGTVTFDATSTGKTITSGGASFNNLTVNGVGGEWALQDALDVNGALTITNGTLDLNSNNLDLTGGSFSNSGILKLVGSEILTNFTNDTDSGTVEYNGSAGPYSLIAGNSYYNLTISGSGTYNLSNTLDVDGNLIISAGTLAGGSYAVTIGGSLTNSAAFTTSGTVTFDATSTGKTITSGTAIFNNLTFNGTGGEWALQDALDVDGTLTITNGTLDLNTNSFDLTGGSFSNTSTLKLTGSETLTNFTNNTDSGLVEYYGSTGPYSLVAGNTYYNLTISGSGTYNLDNVLDINGNLIISAGTLAAGSYAVNIVGSLTNSATFTTSGTVTFDGTSTGKTITLGGTSINNLTFNGVGGQWTLQDALDVDGNLTITNGGLVAGAYAVNIGGSLTNSATFTTSGTVTFDATSTGKTITSGGASFNNLTVNGVGGEWVLQDALDVNGALTITNGTLDLNSNNLDLTGGSFSNSGILKLVGSEILTNFTNDIDSGTIEYTGTNTYTGLAAGNTYYHLTFSGSGTYTLTANLDINGNLTFTASGGSAFANGYSYRKSIIIDNTKVDEALTNYPLLFSVTDTDLRTTGNGGYVTDANGYDIIFTDSGGTTLDFEIEKYDASTGQVVAWVRMPALSDTADTTVYVYYGNSSVSTSQENVTAVWDSNYQGVWHMDETSGTVYDSTSNTNNGTAYGGVTQDAAGQIDGADSFAGDNDYVNIGTVLNSVFSGTNPWTVSLWVNGSSSMSYGSPFSKGRDTVGFSIHMITNGRIRGGNGAGNSFDVNIWTGNDIADDNWHFITVTYNGSNFISYIDGSYQETNSWTYGLGNTSSETLRIGQMPIWSNTYFDGLIDETRISDTPRSEGWISTTHNNQDSPSTFYSTGSQTGSGSSAILNAGAYDINIAGNLSNSNGTLNTSGTVTFDGTLTGKTIISDGISFNNLTFNGTGGEWILQDALDVNNDLIITNGSLVAGANDITIAGNFTNSAAFTTSGTVTFDSTSTGKTITSGGASFYNLTFNGTGGEWTLQDALDVDGNLTITNGSLTAGTYAVNIEGNLSNSGTFTTSGTVTFDGTSTGKTITSGGASFNNLTFNGTGGEWTLQDALDVNAALTITNGTLDLNNNNLDLSGGSFSNSGTLKLIGSETLTNFTNDTNSGLVEYYGTSSYTGLLLGNTYYNLTFSGSGSYTLDNALDVDGNLVISAGTLAAGAYAVNIAGSLTNSATFTTSGTVTFDGTQAGKTIASDGISFNNLTFNGTGGEWILQDALDVNNDLIITNGSLAAGANDITITGNFTNSAVFTTSGTVTFDATSTGKTITSGGASFNNLTFNGTSGGWTLQDALDVNGTLTITNGSLVTGAYAVNIAGNLSNSGTFTTSGTVTFDGTSPGKTITSGGANFNNLTFNGAGGEWTLQDALDVNGTLSITNGTLDLNTNSFDLTGGSFSNTSTLKLTGSETLTNFTNDTDSGLVEYYGSTGPYSLVAGYSYYNLTISGSGSFTAAGNLVANGNFVQSAGTFISNPAAYTFSVGGNFSIAGTFNRFTGSGTGPDPYLIYDVYGLQAMKQSLSATYNLANNVDASGTSGWNSGAGFEPAGNGSTQFTGTFDGNNYTVTGLYINRSSTNYIGLFGYSNGGTISNVGLVDINISGSAHTGGLVGYNYSGTITNSYATGTVSSGGKNTGGLVGNNYKFGTISNSYATGSVSSAEASTGGLVGGNGGTITNSYATGNVSGADGTGNGKTGGLVGGNGGTITNSYATGNVSSTGLRVGGLVGENWSGTITNCYSTGTVNGNDPVGGLVGRNYQGTVNNSYWDTETSGQSSSAGGTGKTTAEMMTQSTFSGWDFASTWEMQAGTTYPYLQWCYPSGAKSITGYVYTDRGTTKIGSGASVALAINGSAKGTASTGATSMFYLLADSSDLSNGNAVLVYIDNHATYDGNTVTIANASGITGLDIYANTVIARHENAGPVTNAAFNTAKGSLPDADILYSVSGSDLDVNADLLIRTGKTFAPGGDTVVSGSFINNGTFTHGNNTVSFDGTATGKTITSGGASFYDLTFNGAGGEWTLQDALDLDNDLTISNGTLAAGANAINIAGSFSNAGTFTTSGTVTFDAASTGKTITSGGASFYNLTFNGTGGEWTLQDAMDVDNDLIISAGSLVTGSNSVTIAGNFTNSATFTTLGTVTFDGSGTSTVSGSTTFYNLTCTTAGKQLTFTAGTTQTITGTFTLTGELGNQVVLRSTVSDSQWNIDPQGGRYIYEVDVKDSNNINAAVITANNSVNSGNNTNWELAWVISGTVYSDMGSTLIGQGKTIVLVLNGVNQGSNSTDTNSNYTFSSISLLSGDVLLVYIDNDSVKGNTVIIVLNQGVSGLNIYGNTVIARHDNSGPVTNSTFSTAKGSLTDTDIIYSVSGSDLTLNSGVDLLVWQNKTYTPGGNLNADDLVIQSGAAYNAAGNQITLTGAFSNDGTLMLTGAETLTNFTNDTNSGIIEYNGSGTYTGLKAGNTYYNLTFSGTGSYTLDNALSVNNTLTLQNGTFIQGANTISTGSFTQAGGTFTGGSANITDSGDFTLSGGTFTSTSGILSLSGNWTLSAGTFNHNSGTVTFDASSTGKTITSGGASFYNLTFNGTGGEWILQDALNAGGNFTLSAGTVTQSANITITGNYSQSAGTFTCSAPQIYSFSVGGSFSISGTFNRFTGSGTGGDPYLVYDVYGLQAMKQNLSAYYNLANNITASGTSGWNSGAGFAPIGNDPNYFTGTFDGQNYTITGLYINRSSTDYVGLFGYAYGAAISNVGLANVYIRGYNNVGSLAGNSSGAYGVGYSITNSYATGSVTGSGDRIGGLVGLANHYAGSITNSYATANVSGNDDVGGLVGLNYGSITNCYATGNVSGSGFRGGGLVGQSRYSGAVITNSYATGSLSGGGGLVGSLYYGASVSNSYWNTQTSGRSTSAGGTGKTTAEMKQQSTFSGWNFSGTWAIVEGETYPFHSSGDKDIWGYVYTNQGTTKIGSDATVALVINGSAIETVLTDALPGASSSLFYFSVTNSVLSDGDAVLVYIDNHATYEGNTVTIVSTSGITGLDIYGNTVIARHENAGPITNATFNTAKGALTDSDIIYSLSGSDLTLSSGVDSLVWQNKTYTPGGNLITDDLIIQSGSTYTVGGNQITLTGAVSNDGTLKLQGDETLTGFTNDIDSGVTEYVGAGTYPNLPINTYYNLTISGSGSFTAGSSISVSGDFVQSAGTFVAPTGNLTLQGNFTRSGGTFIHNNGTVVFSGAGTSVISGSTTFYNLTCTTGGKQLTFTAGTTQTITGTLTLTGQSGNLIVLRSTVSDTQWNIDPQGTRDVSYVDVKDSNNINTTVINITSSDNSGNNTNWQLVYVISGTVYSDRDLTLIGQGKTIVLVINGVNQESNSTDINSNYSFLNASYFPGDVILLYIDNDSIKGNTVIVVSGQKITGPNIYGNTIIARYENVGPITNAAFNTGKGSLTDTDILYSVSGSDLSLTSGVDLLVWQNKTYTPGGNLTLSGNFFNNGTLKFIGTEILTGFTNDTDSGTVEYTGSGTYANLVAGNSYYNLTISGTGSFTAGSNLDVNGDFTQSAGTFTQSANITITGDYSQSSGTFTCSAPQTYTFSVGGNFSVPDVAGAFNRFGGSNPDYTIYDVYALQMMKYYLDKNFTLGSNIDASGTSNWNSGAGFEPVSTYTGTFDGQNYTVTGLYINRSSIYYVGLFGYTNGATISNVGLVDVDITGDRYVGGLVGRKNGGSISNSYATGSVGGSVDVGGLVGTNTNEASITGSYAAGSVSGGGYVGGLVGYNYGSSISNSYAINTVSGDSYVGGLVGCNYGTARITNSYATGNVSAGGGSYYVYVGGLVGYNYGSSISNSYATGNVSASSGYYAYVGGLVGENYSSSISNSYATGNVSASNSPWYAYVGGLVGKNWNGSTVTNSYWDTQTSGRTFIYGGVGLGSSSGVTGKTTAQMKQQSTFSSWDFASTWAIVEGETYPFHQWYYSTGDKDISGNVYTDQGTTKIGSGIIVALAINGSIIDTVLTGVLPGSASSLFYFSVTNSILSNEDAVLIYIDNHATYEGNTVTIASTSDITGLDIYGNTVIARHENAGPITNAAFNTAKGSLTDSDILYTVSGNDLVLDSGVDFLVWQGKTYTPGGSDLTCNSLIIQAGATYTASGSDIITISGNFLNNGTFNPLTSTVIFDGTSTGKTITSGGANFNNLTFNGTGGGWTLQDALDVNGNLSLTAGTLAAGIYAVNVGGNFSNSAIFTTSGTVTFDGTSTGKTITSGGASFNNLTFNGTGGGWTLQDALDVNGNLSLTAGTLDVSASNYGITVGGNFTRTSGIFTPGSGTVIFDGSGVSTISDSITFYNLTVSATGTCIAPSTLNVNGDFSQSAGTFTAPSGSFTIQGNFTHSGGTFNHNNGTLVLDKASGTQILDTGGSALSNLTHSGAGTLQLANALAVTNTLTNSAGILDLNGNNLTMTGAIFDNTATLKLIGSETITGFTNDITSGIVDYAGSGTYPGLAAGYSYYNLVISGSGSFSAASDLTANEDYTQNAGTFTAPSGDFTIGDDFIFNGGTFNHNNGTVILDGENSDVYGSVTFYNLKRTHSSSITFEAGTTQTIEGLLTLTGTSSVRKLVLKSSVPGQRWYLRVTGTYDLNNLDIKDVSVLGTEISMASSRVATFLRCLGWQKNSPVTSTLPGPIPEVDVPIIPDPVSPSPLPPIVVPPVTPPVDSPGLRPPVNIPGTHDDGQKPGIPADRKKPGIPADRKKPGIPDEEPLLDTSEWQDTSDDSKDGQEPLHPESENDKVQEVVESEPEMISLQQVVENKELYRVNSSGRRRLENLYMKNYTAGNYKTTVIVFSGAVVVAPYDSSGADYAAGSLIALGEKKSVDGIVGPLTREEPKQFAKLADDTTLVQGTETEKTEDEESRKRKWKTKVLSRSKQGFTTIENAAEIVDFEGAAEVKHFGGGWIPARVGMLITEGDIVRTKDDSSILLSLGIDGDIATVEATENSQLYFSEFSKDAKTGTQKTVLDLVLGKVLVDVQQMSDEYSKFEVKTPTSIVGVRG